MDISKARCVQCDKALVVQRMACVDCDIAVEGTIEISPLAQLSQDDQIFVTAFVRSHGSIKAMEALFEVSYPTVKNRLNRIATELDASFTPAPRANVDILEQLERGEISVDEALEFLS